MFTSFRPGHPLFIGARTVANSHSNGITNSRINLAHSRLSMVSLSSSLEVPGCHPFVAASRKHTTGIANTCWVLCTVLLLVVWNQAAWTALSSACMGQECGHIQRLVKFTVFNLFSECRVIEEPSTALTPLVFNDHHCLVGRHLPRLCRMLAAHYTA